MRATSFQSSARSKLSANHCCLLFVCLIALLSACSSQSISIRTAFDNEVNPRVDGSRIARTSYKMPQTGEQIPYALYVPENYSPDREWPLIVGFMGSGMHYDTLFSFLNVIEMAEQYGYIIVTPLGYVRGSNMGLSSVSSINTRAEQDVFNVLELVRENYNVAEQRIFLWGHSAGATSAYNNYVAQGKGPWAGLAMFAPPDNFSPRVSSGRNLEGFKVLVQIGNEDTEGQAQSAVARMREHGLDAKYEEVEGGHFLWWDRGDTIESMFLFFEAI